MSRAQPSVFARARQWIGRAISGQPALQMRRFAAAQNDRFTAGWLSTMESINQELHSDLNSLRTRARGLVNNNDYARKFRGMVEDNIIGPNGIRLQCRVEDPPPKAGDAPKPDRMANKAIEAAWAEWCAACDVTGQMTFVDVCKALIGGMPSDGEFLVRIVKGAAAGNRFNFALQVIDVDRIDTTYNDKLGDDQVINGVQVNAYRRPVGVWVFASHPNDGARSSRQRIFLGVNETLHRFRVERAEQVRGIPWMAPGMLSLHHLGGFKLAALLAAEHGANHFGFFTTLDGNAPAIGATEGEGTEAQQISVSQPGMFDTLPNGTTFQPYDSKYPSETFGPFVKVTLQRIATGWRVAYHSLANDLEGVSFSSIRSGTLEERDRWAGDQEWFIGAFMEPVYVQWLQMALLSGAITMPNGSPLPASKIAKFAKHEWQPRRWEWVDPKSDSEAKISMVRAGLISPQDLAAGMGYDFEDTIAAISVANKLAAEYGVSLNAYDGTPGANSAQQPQQQQAAAAQKQAAQDAANARQLEPLVAELRALRDMVTMQGRGSNTATPTTLNLSTREIEAGLNAAVSRIADQTATHLATMSTNMQDTAERMAASTITAFREMPAPVINVAAPVVNVAAPEVTVEAVMPPAQVVVAGPASSRQTVERNQDQEITATVTTYAYQE